MVSPVKKHHTRTPILVAYILHVRCYMDRGIVSSESGTIAGKQDLTPMGDTQKVGRVR